GDVSGRGKLGTDMREIWMMQPRFDKRVGTSPFSLVEQPRFRAGFDFLRLRAQTGEVDEELAHWWETFSLADDDHRRDMVDAQRKANQPKAAGARVRRVKKDDAAAAQASEDDPRFRSIEEEEGADGEPAADDGMPSSDGSAPAKK